MNTPATTLNMALFPLPYRVVWWLVFAVLSMPLAWLVNLGLNDGLGANPIEFINRFLGDWALRMILVSLAATPLKILFGWRWPVRVRRMLGLWAFTYVALHITNYVVVDNFFAWDDIWKDIVKRNFITVGMVAFTIITSLAATSWNGAIKRMGSKSWRRLHKLVYVAAALGSLHYIWMVKADLLLPLVHSTILAVLLAIRVYAHITRPA